MSNQRPFKKRFIKNLRPLGCEQEPRVEGDLNIVCQCIDCKYHINQKCMNTKSYAYCRETSRSHWCCFGKNRVDDKFGLYGVEVPIGGFDG